jgi:hypothetical protein
MPRHRRRDEDLIASAIGAMEDEIRCWREGPPGYPYGSRLDPIVRLIRYPRMDICAVGPADYIPEAKATVEHVELPKKEVPYFLRWQGMEAAIKKMRELGA